MDLWSLFRSFQDEYYMLLLLILCLIFSSPHTHPCLVIEINWNLILISNIETVIFISILSIKIMSKVTELHWPRKTSSFVNRSKSAKMRDVRGNSKKVKSQAGTPWTDWSNSNAASLRIFEEFGVSDFSRYQILAKYTPQY